jgi:hypothetical protein
VLEEIVKAKKEKKGRKRWGERWLKVEGEWVKLVNTLEETEPGGFFRKD